MRVQGQGQASLVRPASSILDPISDVGVSSKPSMPKSPKKIIRGDV
jgi:hypothetical protein